MNTDFGPSKSGIATAQFLLMTGEANEEEDSAATPVPEDSP